MTKKQLNEALAAVLFASIALPAAADTIYSGTVIGSTPASLAGFEAQNLVNQSGLSTPYVSGVTNFEAYTSTGPTHTGSSFAGGGYFAPAPAFVDIDLGSTLTLTKFALWNDNDFQGVQNFNLLVADNASFSGATSLGSFTATFGPPFDHALPIAIQLFDLTDGAGQFVRVNFVNPHAENNINVGELAFGAVAVGGPIGSVPEPGSLALLGAALGAFGLSRKRKKT